MTKEMLINTIRNFASDTSRSLEETIGALEDAREEIDSRLEVMEADLDD